MMTCYEALLPVRTDTMHKGDRGGVLIVGGSEIYRGAPILAARGALRSGCGLAVIFSDESVCAAAAASLPESVFLNGLFHRPQEKVTELLNAWESRIDCMVLGPGLGRSDEAGLVFQMMIEAWRKPLIIDGDGLYWLAMSKDSTIRRDGILLTPHEGETAHLLGVPRDSVSQAREDSARMIASIYGTVLLKGRRTLIDDGSITKAVEEGNQALAVPGSGDVLSGAIAAFSASGLSLFDSACLGSCVHGRAGKMVFDKYGVDGGLASEVADAIPMVLKRMRMG